MTPTAEIPIFDEKQRAWRVNIYDADLWRDLQSEKTKELDIDSGDVVVVSGAGTGAVPVWLLETKKVAHVYAIESDPRYAIVFSRNLAHRKGVTSVLRDPVLSLRDTVKMARPSVMMLDLHGRETEAHVTEAIKLAADTDQLAIWYGGRPARSLEMDQNLRTLERDPWQAVTDDWDPPLESGVRSLRVYYRD